MGIQLIEQAELAGGDFEGYLFGSSVSVIFERDAAPGFRVRLHRHPYDETFIVRSGRVLFTVGEDEAIVAGGQIVIAPAQTPHRFEVLGPEPYDGVHIHAGPRFQTEALE